MSEKASPTGVGPEITSHNVQPKNSVQVVEPTATVVSEKTHNYSVSQEYVEYLDLDGVFQGEKLNKLIRKVDFHVLPQLIVLYLLAYIDRTNVGNAKLFGVLKDLGISGTQWNVALSVFYASYSFTGPFANIALKRVGPKIWLPCLLLGCSLVTFCTSLQRKYAGWVAFRVLLGFVEAGIFPGCSFVMSNWYAPKEVHTRMALFFSAASASGAFSGLLAYVIGQLDGTWGYRGWRFIYGIEGFVTIFLAIGAFFVILDNPAKSGKWLAEDEKRFLVLRHRFIAGEGQGIPEKEAFSWKHAGAAFKSIHTYAIGLIEFALNTTINGVSFTLPTIISNMGYSAANAQLLSIPPYVFACMVTVASGVIGDRYQKRMLAVVIPYSIALVGYAIVIGTVTHKHLTGVTHFGTFLITGGLYPVTPASTAWISLNCAGSMKRSVGIGGMFMFANWGGVLGSNIYLAKEAPGYSVGFGTSLGMVAVFGIMVPLGYWFILRSINRKRDLLSIEEVRAKYTDDELSEMGDLSPLFRYSL